MLKIARTMLFPLLALPPLHHLQLRHHLPLCPPLLGHHNQQSLKTVRVMAVPSVVRF